MTKKITDLEGRLAAAFARAPKLDTIGRYKMTHRKGMVPAEIVFAKVTDEDKVEFVTWERRLSDPGLKWGGHYFATFREALSDFLKRVEADGARS